MTSEESKQSIDRIFYEIPVRELGFSDVVAEIQRRVLEDAPFDVLFDNPELAEQLFDIHSDNVFLEVLERFLDEE